MPENSAARKFIFARAKIQISIFLTNVAKLVSFISAHADLTNIFSDGAMGE